MHPLQHPFSRAQAKSGIRVGWRSIAARVAHRPLPPVDVQDLRSRTIFQYRGRICSITSGLSQPEMPPWRAEFPGKVLASAEVGPGGAAT
jgi:hypothetical protein